MKLLSIILCFLVLATTPTLAATLSGKVVAVEDGDTLTVLTPDKQQVKVRLVEIDAPEKDQPYGQKSKQSLSDMVFGKEVRVEWNKTDKYKRTLGRIFVGDLDVNLQQVKNGAAWAYTQYLTDDRIQAAETEARNTKAGLWALQADQIMPPWEWRQGKPAHNSTNDNNLQPLGCGDKTKCKQMRNCDEAKFYLTVCNLQRIDGDRDGIPCEALCRR